MPGDRGQLKAMGGSVPLISVVLCTCNPSRDVLEQTLSALRLQTFPIECWELILVDNNSDPPLSPSNLQAFHPSARCLREPRQGKLFALIKGIQASTAELIMTVDDDSLLESDYLETAFRIHQAHPDLGAFGAGAISPLYETRPPEWFADVSGLLALRSLPSPSVSKAMKDGSYRPWGLGLCVTRSVAQAWLSWCEDNLGRVLAVKGRKASCLEDDLFSMCAVSLDFFFGVFPGLRVGHIISSPRLEESYLKAMARDHGYSHAQLSIIGNLSLGYPDPPASLKVAIAFLLGCRFSLARQEFSRWRSQSTEPLLVRQVRHEKALGWKEAIRDYHNRGLIPWKETRDQLS